jgi:ABC-2 type transport system permease protein
MVVERIVAGVADYRTLAAAKLRSDWQYRAGFVAMFAATLLVTAMDFAGIAVIFTKTPDLGGWGFREVAFLYGVAGVSFGLADFLVGSVEQISPRVRTGVFDLLLIRPVNVLVHLTASEFTFRRIGKVAQALVVLVAATALVDIEWTLGRIVMLPLTIVSGTVIACATWVITASIAFFTVETQEIANTFTYGGDLATSYPLHIFESWLRVLVTYLVPLVFVSYLPALYILDLETPLALPSWLRFASPLAALAMAVAARAVWRAGLRHYRSTGS